MLCFISISGLIYAQQHQNHRKDHAVAMYLKASDQGKKSHQQSHKLGKKITQQDQNIMRTSSYFETLLK